MKEFHRRDFANRTGLAQAWTVKSADRLFTTSWNGSGEAVYGKKVVGTDLSNFQPPYNLQQIIRPFWSL